MGGGRGGGGSPRGNNLSKPLLAITYWALSKALFRSHLGSLPLPSLPSPHDLTLRLIVSEVKIVFLLEDRFPLETDPQVPCSPEGGCEPTSAFWADWIIVPGIIGMVKDPFQVDDYPCEPSKNEAAF